MNENGEQRTTAPLVHGRMVYRCEVCGRSWFMYLEKGIEEFGENHKPSPFTIDCPYCDGWASDVSGIQKIPGGRYARLTGGYMYFANLEDRNCGVPMLYEDGIARSGTKMLTADEPDSVNRGQSNRRIMDKLLEDVQKRTEEYIEAAVTMGLLADAKAEPQDFMKAVRILAKQSTNSLEEVMEAIVKAILGGHAKPGNTRRTLNKLDLARIRKRKKEQKKARTMERENVSRFRQYQDRERVWTTRKRTGQRRREWRGPWKEKNN